MSDETATAHDSRSSAVDGHDYADLPGPDGEQQQQPLFTDATEGDTEYPDRRRVSLDERLSTVLEDLIVDEPFSVQTVMIVTRTLFDYRKIRALSNNKCIRSLANSCKVNPSRLVTLSLLITHLITKDESDQLKTSRVFLKSQKNFLASLERLYTCGTFLDAKKKEVLVQIVFSQVRNGGLEAETVLRWLRYHDSYAGIPTAHFVSMKRDLASFSDWLRSTLDSSDEEDEDDDVSGPDDGSSDAQALPVPPEDVPSAEDQPDNDMETTADEA